MMDTARLALPLLDAGQAQKEMTVNEALAQVDLATQASVEAVGVDTPPASPTAGQCWIVGNAPTGAWAGQAGAIAGWTAGGWRFVRAREGLRAWSVADGATAVRSGGQWRTGVLSGERVEIGGVKVLGARGPAIAAPAGGSVIDTEARAALAALLAAARAHGLIAP